MSIETARLILASTSPRRAKMLETLGLSFEVIGPHVDESPLVGEIPAHYVVRIARAKAERVASGLSSGLVLAADTAVIIDGQPLGKPSDHDDACKMLRLLSGQWHAVMSGVALRDAATGREVADCDKTLVRFRDLSDEDIEAYVQTREPLDKAGAYAIQGRGMLFVEEIAGNYHNVVGLPATLIDRLFKKFGINLMHLGGGS